MDHTFDVDAYISGVGERLVQAFDNARSATSPTAIGDAMEHPVRTQLEQILPRGIGVGSGFVIDSSGATSHQTDVILYERDICPVLSINDTPGTSYYPCEGVIAVGQVKSVLNRRLLSEEFRKIASVKRLQRHPVNDFMPHPTTGRPIVLKRSYGSLQNPSIIDVTERSEPDETGQILGFIIAGKVEMQPPTLMEAFRVLTKETSDALAPNMAVVLTGGLLTWGKITKRRVEKTGPDNTGTYGMRVFQDGPSRLEPAWSAQSAQVLSYSEELEPFRSLIRWIYETYRTGQTSDARAFDQYFLPKNGPNLAEVVYVPKLQ